MITVTEILGTDSLSSSRITINNNFNTLKTAVNNLFKYFEDNSTIGSDVYDVKGNNISGKNVSATNILKIGSTELTEAQLQSLLALLEE